MRKFICFIFFLYIITYDSSSFDMIENYMTYFFTYDDLCGRGIAAKTRYFFDADELEKKKFTALAGVAATVAAGVAGALIKKK